MSGTCSSLSREVEDESGGINPAPRCWLVANCSEVVGQRYLTDQMLHEWRLESGRRYTLNRFAFSYARERTKSDLSLVYGTKTFAVTGILCRFENFKYRIHGFKFASLIVVYRLQIKSFSLIR